MIWQFILRAGGGRVAGWEVFRDLTRLQELRHATKASWSDMDALVEVQRLAAVLRPRAGQGVAENGGNLRADPHAGSDGVGIGAPVAIIEGVPVKRLGTPEDMAKLVKEETKKDFPDEPLEQLRMAINAVFSSWFGARAITYRRLYGIPDSWGTAVNVVAMVFGKRWKRPGSSRNWKRLASASWPSPAPPATA